MGYDDMKIAVQIDVVGDGSYLSPEKARTATTTGEDDQAEDAT